MLESWRMDLKYAARRLQQRPLYAIVSVLTLALGIGGTAAAFGLVQGLLLSPLPYADESRLSLFWAARGWSEQELLYMEKDWQGFTGVAAYKPQDLPFRQSAEGTPKLVPAVKTTAGIFDVLGVRPALGRTFEANEDRPGAAPAVIISDALYKELGGSPSLLGSTVDLDGKGHTLVGVMAPQFWFPDPTIRAWVVEPLDEEDASGNWALVGRRAPGTDGAALKGSLERIAARLDERYDYPAQWDKTKNPTVTPLREHQLGALEAPLLATLGAMALLLLIACANVAALMLGQVDARATELAVRMALGADARRMVQQLLAEALLIGLGAAAVGAAVAAQGFRMLTEALPLGSLAPKAELSWGVFFATLTLALVAALGVALLPARSLRRSDPQRTLATAKTGGIGARGGRTEGALVIGQVAIAVLLTAAAALLVRSVTNLRAIDPGIDTGQVAVIDVVMEADTEPEARQRLISELEVALSALPGVKVAASVQKLPLRGMGDSWGIQVEGKPELGKSTTFVRMVTPQYFETMGIRLLAGRLLTSDDRADTEPVVVVNQALAKKYFPGEDALNKRVSAAGMARIVGIVEDISEAGLTDGPAPARYISYAQMPQYTPARHALVLRTEPGRDPSALLEDARRELGTLAPSLAIQRTMTLEAVLAQALGPARQVMTVLTLLTVLAVILGAVGVYGITAQFVRRRRRDLGIQIALGLRPSRVVTGIVRRGAVLVLIGSAVGTVAAIVLARLLQAFLYGVSAIDPLSLVAATVALLAVGVGAALIPAVRASRMDPASVFREA